MDTRPFETSLSAPVERHGLSIRYDTRLPVYGKREEIARILRENRVVVVAGETASGKTTQLPLMCLECASARGPHRVVCTQPRRIAATSIASFVARQCGCAMGAQVGYRVRFDEKESPATVLSFVTDGMLLTEIRSDPLLRRYGTVVIDEAHERSLNIDFLLGYLRLLLKRRPDLRLVVSSATINTGLFSRAFDDAPVVEVSGRLFPVTVIHDACDGLEGGYIEGAVAAVEKIRDMDEEGDILVFMPTEQDIRETIDLMEGRGLDRNAQILPLFGRLASRDQNRIFQHFGRRKIVVATNIAETSITVPGIRFVVDTGLARMVRYVPNLSTNRMPVEPVSRANALQRTGRCGRVADGVCIRLYAREDFESREEFPVPEIRRTDLAGVILQMKNLNLGDIAGFPFIEPPSARSVRDGLARLTHLGAIDEKGNLTPTGRRMAQLPLDPHVARMVLQAADEHCLREVKIIAAGLSIADPRERPADREAQADAAHKRFLDPLSDFLTYLKLWDAFQDRWTSLRTWNRMRRFCADHFLSFSRMREWHDIHRQIDDICRGMKGFADNAKPAGYEAIHRSLLTGLLLNAAMRKNDGVGYKATRGRDVLVFPGSSLYRQKHPWIMCHQIVETSQVFCRTCAKIDPLWLELLAPALCRRSYAEPAFDPRTGSVRALEQVTFFGLPLVRSRPVQYGRINSLEAAEVFAREALAGGALVTRHRFLEHNRALQEHAASMEERLRRRGLCAGDEAAAAFYRERTGAVSSAADLDKLIRQRGGDGFLRMSLQDLLTGDLPAETEQYPDELEIGGARFPLSYAYAPDSDGDGVTVRVPAGLLGLLGTETLEWALSALWKERVRFHLAHLPSDMRRRFVPVEQHAERIASLLAAGTGPFGETLSAAVTADCGTTVDASRFDARTLPLHLRLRVAVVGADGETGAAYRLPDLPAAPPVTRLPAGLPRSWGAALQPILARDPSSVASDGVPARLVVPAETGDGAPLVLYPALIDSGDTVTAGLCVTAADAAAAGRSGIRRAADIACRQEWAWLEKELVIGGQAALLCTQFGGREKVRQALIAAVKRHVLCRAADEASGGGAPGALTELTAAMLKGMGHRVSETFSDAAGQWLRISSFIAKKAPLLKGKAEITAMTALKKELARYMQRLFDPGFRLDIFAEYPRYLAALGRRAELACSDPYKYVRRVEPLAGFQSLLDGYRKSAAAPGIERGTQRMVEEFETLVEEYAVSLFAQQAVGTKMPVSQQRLHDRAAAIDAALKTPAGASGRR